jgi:hypothetical protein
MLRVCQMRKLTGAISSDPPVTYFRKANILTTANMPQPSVGPTLYLKGGSSNTEVRGYMAGIIILALISAGLVAVLLVVLLVRRGHDGSKAPSHTSGAAIDVVNPVYDPAKR